jgi:hypothetical protein
VVRVIVVRVIGYRRMYAVGIGVGTGVGVESIDVRVARAQA